MGAGLGLGGQVSAILKLCADLERLEKSLAVLEDRTVSHRRECECGSCQARELTSDAADKAARRLERALEQRIAESEQ